MPNIALAKAEIKAAAGLLTNRFGHESDVFAHLTAALLALKEDDSPIAIDAEVVTASTAAAVVEESEAALSTPPPSPTPTRPRRRNAQ